MSITKVLLLFLCWFVAIEGSSVRAGSFSDRLVGKEKPQVSQPTTQDQITPVTKGQAANSPLPAGTNANEPGASIEQPAVSPSNRYALGVFDVVGLKLGMTQEEAVKIVQNRRRELNGKPIVFETVYEGKHDVLVQGDVPRTKFLAISEAKSVLAALDLTDEALTALGAPQDPKTQKFATQGQIDAFGFQFPNVPNEARISLIAREQRLAPPVHPDTVKAALLEKYGTPWAEKDMIFVWWIDIEGHPVAARAKGADGCVIVQPIGVVAAEYMDLSPLARKGCGEQLAVQLVGTFTSITRIQTVLIHHQRVVDQREATRKAALSRLGLTPEQTKQAPAPQF